MECVVVSGCLVLLKYLVTWEFCAGLYCTWGLVQLLFNVIDIFLHEFCLKVLFLLTGGLNLTGVFAVVLHYPGNMLAIHK